MKIEMFIAVKGFDGSSEDLNRIFSALDSNGSLPVQGVRKVAEESHPAIIPAPATVETPVKETPVVEECPEEETPEICISSDSASSMTDDRDAIKAKLVALGVEFSERARTATLEALLRQHESVSPEAEAKPVEAKPVEAKPVEIPAEEKPAEANPAEAKPAEANPAEANPAEVEVVEIPAEANPAEANTAATTSDQKVEDAKDQVVDVTPAADEIPLDFLQAEVKRYWVRRTTEGMDNATAVGCVQALLSEFGGGVAKVAFAPVEKRGAILDALKGDWVPVAPSEKLTGDM